jgi:peptidoglycan hydrolase CwlO-like protein
MKKFILTLALVCTATLGFAQSENNNAEDAAKSAFITNNATASGITYNFNAANSKIDALNKSIEDHKAGIESDKAAIAALKEEMKKAKSEILNATEITVSK